MRNLLKILFFFLPILVVAQPNTCYILKTDATGFERNYQANLNPIACEIATLLEKPNDFKVFDYGLYLHTIAITGALEDILKLVETRSSDDSPYYMAITKIPSYDKVIERFDVKVKLPNTGEFSCLTPSSIKLIEAKVANKINSYHQKYQSTNFGNAIEEGLKEFKKTIQSVKNGNCCINDEIAMLKSFHDKNFDAVYISKEQPVAVRPSNGNDRSSTVEDYANLTFWIDKQEINLSQSDFGVKTFITKNENFCPNSNNNISIIDDVNTKFKNETNCIWYHIWINPNPSLNSLLLVKQKFNGNEVILDHKTPKEVATIKRYKEVVENQYRNKPHGDYEGTSQIVFKVPIFQFTQSATKLLSLVSGINETEIKNVEIINNMNGILPAYKPSEGGGGMTIPSIEDKKQINIRYTDNYFTLNKYPSNDYGGDIYSWLSISSHEVGHIKHVRDCDCTFPTYAASFGIEYAKNLGHDAAPREQEADKGYFKFNSFDSFLGTKSTSIINIFKSIPDDSQRKNKIIELWALFPNK